MTKLVFGQDILGSRMLGPSQANIMPWYQNPPNGIVHVFSEVHVPAHRVRARHDWCTLAQLLDGQVEPARRRARAPDHISLAARDEFPL